VKSSRDSQWRTQRPVVPFLLPVRLTRWQSLQAWLRQLWHRWRVPQIKVQPPLEPARHKPFPQRPHHRRRQAVFAALATAPPDATTYELIAHVRAVTGLGCSPKLIVAWKRESRPGEGEKGRRGEAGKRKMALQMRLFLFLLAWGCAVGHLARHVGAQEITISPAPSATPEIQPLLSHSPVPRLLRIKLTLSGTQELQVKAGDTVNAGDVLSDHQPTRQRWLVQKRALQAAAHCLQAQMRLTDEARQQLQSLSLALPSTNFAAERAAIQRAETEAIAVNRAVEIQRQKVAMGGSWWAVAGREKADVGTRETESGIRNSLLTDHQPPPTAHQALIAEHEAAKLTQAQDKQLLALSEIEWHKAKLTTAREVRAWEEQKHRVEVTRQRLSARSQQQQGEIELARLTAQIAELDLQLAQLTVVRAPFAGTIKRIEWEEMTNEKLTVLVYLLVGSQ
jgi:biotin carboxyl carrier protein